MNASVDDLTPFDLQVLNLARLQYGTLEFTQSELIVPEFGTFYYPQVDVMQIKDTGKFSRFHRALTIAGGKEMAKLHFELLTRALDFDEMNAENKRIADEKKAYYQMGGAQLGSPLQGRGLLQVTGMQQMQQMQNQSLLGALGQLQARTDAADHRLDALAFNLAAAQANPPVVENEPEGTVETERSWLQNLRDML